jgi:hypothetical protein
MRSKGAHPEVQGGDCFGQRRSQDGGSSGAEAPGFLGADARSPACCPKEPTPSSARPPPGGHRRQRTTSPGTPIPPASRGPREGNSSSAREQLYGNSDSRVAGAGSRIGRGGQFKQQPLDSRPSFGRGFEGRRLHSPSTPAHKAGAALQQRGRPHRHLDEHTSARGGFGRGARLGGSEDSRPSLHLDEPTGARGGLGRGAQAGGQNHAETIACSPRRLGNSHPPLQVCTSSPTLCNASAARKDFHGLHE